jgi:hypothetical protein
MFKGTGSARLAAAARRSPGKGEALTSQDSLPQDAPQTRRPAVSYPSDRNAPHIGNIQKFEPFIFSSLRALFPAQNPQPSPFHAHAHSFAQNKNVTRTFPVTSTLFARSCAHERKLTCFFSIACALFRKTTREGVGVGHLLLPNQNIVTQSIPSRRGCAPAGSATGDFVASPYRAAPQNKSPADQIDTKTTRAVSFRDR